MTGTATILTADVWRRNYGFLL